jgi:hypothetical protein
MGGLVLVPMCYRVVCRAFGTVFSAPKGGGKDTREITMKKTLAVLFATLTILGSVAPAASAAAGGEDCHNKPTCRGNHK